jgi:hypothetical protein
MRWYSTVKTKTSRERTNKRRKEDEVVVVWKMLLLSGDGGHARRVGADDERMNEIMAMTNRDGRGELWV